MSEAFEPSRAGRVGRRLAAWESEGFSRRLWARDHRLWAEEPDPELTGRLGWLDLPRTMAPEVEDLRRFAAAVAAEGVRRVYLLGMGGSSLAPEVFQRTFGAAPGHPDLTVLDSTHPAAVGRVLTALEPAASLVLVSSKSGTTVETLSLFHALWRRIDETMEDPGERFAAITDPDTPLEKLAAARGFRRVFRAPADVGGRFSALSPFGLVPAALLGIDLELLLARARREMDELRAPRPGAALRLGATLGELTLAGRDKLTIFATPELAAFPAWLEQLIAESTGKERRGILPVIGEQPEEPAAYGADRQFVALRLAGADGPTDDALRALRRAGHPVAAFSLADRYDLGAEIVRWEIAVAAAGSILGVNPFDQPDVERAKRLAAAAVAGEAPPAGEQTVAEVAATDPACGEALERWLARGRSDGYVAVQAYLDPDRPCEQALERLRAALRRRTGQAVTVGFGPRYLHSTGQLHKGGQDGGLFLQLVDRPGDELPVPERGTTFGRLIAAQALGDARALAERGRAPLRVLLGADAVAALDALAGRVVA